MPSYDFRCTTCDSTTVEFFKIADRPKTITCSCGGTAEFIITAPAVMNHAYHDGVRRAGWADIKEAAKLKKLAANEMNLEKKKEIEKAIRSIGVKHTPSDKGTI